MFPTSDNGSTVGAVGDMAARLRATLPTGWFPVSPPTPAPSATPVLDGLLAGLGSAWSFCFGLLSTVAEQTRLSTASGPFLDMASFDFFGTALSRRAGESDSSFRSRISAELLMRRGTRQDVGSAVAQITSVMPLICEPTQALDCGGYASAGNATPGGGFGYCTPALHYGSRAFPFQYFIRVAGSAVFAPGVVTARESWATFLDGDGLMQLAAPLVLRPNYEAGHCVGALLEDRGFNLIPDSRGWTGFAQSPVGAAGVASWSVDGAGPGLLQADSVLTIMTLAGTRVPGPSIDVAAGGVTMTASCWIFIPSGSSLSAVELVLTDLNVAASSIYVPADLTLAGKWQRVSASLQAKSAAGKSLRMQLVLTCAGAAEATLNTQCWQIEPGAAATSYIPTSGALGIRAPDQVATAQVSTPPAVFTETDVLDAIASAIPAATIAWTAVFPPYVAEV